MADLNHLFCEQCNDVHRFTRAEVEKVVQSLIAHAADNLTLPAEPTDWDPMLNTLCLRRALAWARDGEMYLEWVEGAIDARRTTLTPEETS